MGISPVEFSNSLVSQWFVLANLSFLTLSVGVHSWDRNLQGSFCVAVITATFLFHCHHFLRSSLVLTSWWYRSSPFLSSFSLAHIDQVYCQRQNNHWQNMQGLMFDFEESCANGYLHGINIWKTLFLLPKGKSYYLFSQLKNPLVGGFSAWPIKATFPSLVYTVFPTCPPPGRFPPSFLLSHPNHVKSFAVDQMSFALSYLCAFSLLVHLTKFSLSFKSLFKHYLWDTLPFSPQTVGFGPTAFCQHLKHVLRYKCYNSLLVGPRLILVSEWFRTSVLVSS